MISRLNGASRGGGVESEKPGVHGASDQIWRSLLRCVLLLIVVSAGHVDGEAISAVCVSPAVREDAEGRCLVGNMVFHRVEDVSLGGDPGGGLGAAANPESGAPSAPSDLPKRKSGQDSRWAYGEDASSELWRRYNVTVHGEAGTRTPNILLDNWLDDVYQRIKAIVGDAPLVVAPRGASADRRE